MGNVDQKQDNGTISNTKYILVDSLFETVADIHGMTTRKVEIQTVAAKTNRRTHNGTEWEMSIPLKHRQKEGLPGTTRNVLPVRLPERFIVSPRVVGTLPIDYGSPYFSRRNVIVENPKRQSQHTQHWQRHDERII